MKEEPKAIGCHQSFLLVLKYICMGGTRRRKENGSENLDGTVSSRPEEDSGIVRVFDPILILCLLK